MTPLYRLAASILLAVALLVGGYWKGRVDGGKHVRQEWDQSLLVQQRALFDAQRLATETERENRELAKRIGDELEPALQAATDRAVALSRSLREYQERSRRCALSLAARAPERTDGTPGEPADGSGVDAALESHLSACARDAERLGKLQEWVRGVR